MHRALPTRPLLALAALPCSWACRTVVLEETERQAFFVDTRLQKRLSAPENTSPLYLEFDWTSTHGSSGTLDYTLGTTTLGALQELPLGEHATLGFGGGFSWQRNDLSETSGVLEVEDGYGLYVALEGTWHATSWLEPHARLSAVGALNELSSVEVFEAGLRWRVLEDVALFTGWRHAKYEIDDVNSAVAFDSVELTASGLVIGLHLAF